MRASYAVKVNNEWILRSSSEAESKKRKKKKKKKLKVDGKDKHEVRTMLWRKSNINSRLFLSLFLSHYLYTHIYIFIYTSARESRCMTTSLVFVSFQFVNRLTLSDHYCYPISWICHCLEKDSMIVSFSLLLSDSLVILRTYAIFHLISSFSTVHYFKV